MLLVLLILGIIYIFILPTKLFNDPYSTVILDKKENLLGAHIAQDHQWRFPPISNIPDKFKNCITQFEDKRFFYHPGFDPISIIRAIYQNIQKMDIVSGGSTLTMQVVRLSRKNKKRTVLEKIWEIILATRIELSYSKNKILSMYASHAPFGGNVVGLNAASWRYFGRKAEDLSWAESALLAVLPNSPALIHPGKNRELLKNKRNRLLKKLFNKEIISKETYILAIEEPIPEKPKAYPQLAPHLLDRIRLEQNNEGIYKTTIDIELQEYAYKILNKHYRRLSGNEIYNAAIIIIEVESGNILSYIGNTQNVKDESHSNSVDVIPAARSTGSILKPFLYASMLTSGDILPNALVPDIPIKLGDYMPENYNLGYDGAIPAKRALARSLNIPAVKMLQNFGIERLHYNLKKLGMTTLNKPSSHYGLSLILGGCEGSLYEVSGIYASMARSLNNYFKRNSKYTQSDYFPPKYLYTNNESTIPLENNSILSASAIYFTFKAMLDVERPPEESQWEMFSSSQRIAWKTGTSFGFRDAWAIGITPDYVVGVWTGNADGEGRPGLVGIKASAPILFDIFKRLPKSQDWFAVPYDDMIQTDVCDKSGYLASDICNKTRKKWIPASGANFEICPYHKIIHLDKSMKWQVNSNCESPANMIHKPWFVLPPVMEWYYKQKNSTYKELPPFRTDCVGENRTSNMQIIYPTWNAKIYVPIDLDEQQSTSVFEVKHRNENATIYWHIDNEFITETKYFHKINVNPSPGDHILTVIDENGEKLIRKFTIIND